MMHPGRNNLPVVTGKPLEIGGSQGRHEATAQGCLYAAQHGLRQGLVPGLSDLTGARLAVQGFGNAGSIASRLFTAAGANLIAVSDSRGGVVRDQGLDWAALARHKEKTGSVVGMPGAQAIRNEDLLALPCDVLIPAALENQIRSDNAEAVQARFIVEAANGPTTPGADSILFRRGIPVMPDILANSGGVCVSYFEWVQNIENQQWDLDEVQHKLKTKMERATDAVIARQREIGARGASLIDLRTAALVVAIERVANAALKRGIWP
jgi:glutamate dehydrogenase (NAD(P)+)